MAIEKLAYKDITFIGALKRYGILPFILSTETIISSGLIIIGYMLGIVPTSHDIAKNIMPLTLSISASIFAVEIAGFTIVASLSDRDFLSLLWRTDALIKIFFPFVWCSLFWTLTILLGLVVYLQVLLVNSDTFPESARVFFIMQVLYFWLFTYTLILTYRLLLTVMRFSVVRGFSSYKCQKALEEKEEAESNGNNSQG